MNLLLSWANLKYLFFLSKPVYAVVMAGVITVFLLLFSSSNLLPETPDNWFNDWRTYVWSKQEPEQHKEIAVVVIDQDTLENYPYRSPVDRLFLADLVKDLDAAGPAAIGLDFIFDWPTEKQKDEYLIEVIRKAKSKIVLGGLDTTVKTLGQRAFDFQKTFIEKTGRPVGHLYFSQHIDRLKLEDQAVRLIAPSFAPKNWESFGRVLAEYDGSKPNLKSRYISWLLPPSDQRQKTFASFKVPKHDPRDTNTALQDHQFFSPAVKEALKGKIVIVAAAFTDTNVDRHLTPLSIADRSRMHGAFIHAQIVAQIREGRSLAPVPALAVAIIAFLIAFVTIYSFYKWSFSGQYIYDLIFISVLIAISSALFYYFYIMVPTDIFFYAWVLGNIVVREWFLRLFHFICRVIYRVMRQGTRGNMTTNHSSVFCLLFALALFSCSNSAFADYTVLQSNVDGIKVNDMIGETKEIFIPKGGELELLDTKRNLNLTIRGLYQGIIEKAPKKEQTGLWTWFKEIFTNQTEKDVEGSSRNGSNAEQKK